MKNMLLPIRTYARATALLAAVLALTACSALDRLNQPRPNLGKILAERVEADPLKAEAARNEKLRAERDTSGAMMSVPARPESGVVAEIDLMQRRESGGGRDGAAKGKSAKAVTLEFFEPESLKKIIELMLKDYLKVPYVIQDDFKDKQVKLFMNMNGGRNEILQIFDAFLETQGVRIKYLDGIYLVTMDDKAKRLQPSPSGFGEAIGVLPLQFIDAKDFLPFARQLMREGERAALLPAGQNAIVITSSSSEIRAIRRLADEIDIPFFDGKHILLYAPRYLSAKALVVLLEQYQEQLGSTSAKPNRQIEVREVPDQERVVIVTHSPAGQDLARELLAKSDTPTAQNKRQVFQYTLTTQKAADLAVVVKALLAQVMKGTTTPIEPVADKESNSLMFFATVEEYAEIRKVLMRLDSRAPAVYIDVTIAQVSLGDNLKYGVQWFLERRLFGNDTFARSTLGTTTGAGLNLSFLYQDKRSMILQLLSSETDLTVLSTPQIIVKNGATAKISAATEEPISKTKNTGNNVVTSDIDYKKIGLEMEVTPNIGQDGEIKLAILIKDSSIVATKKVDNNEYPVTSSRELKTELVTRDGSTIFLGGLRQQQSQRSTNRVPLLGNMPGPLGVPFRDVDDKVDSRELIVLLTPTLLLDQEGAERVTRALIDAAKTAGAKDAAAEPPPAAAPAATPAPAAS